jgi:hypothetical protein
VLLSSLLHDTSQQAFSPELWMLVITHDTEKSLIYLLASRARGDEQGILGIDNNEIINSKACH